MSFRQVPAEASQVKVLLDKAIFISSDVFSVFVCLYVCLKWKRTFCVTACFPSTGENKEKDPGTIFSW